MSIAASARRLAAVAGVVLLATVVGVQPASAKVIESEQFGGSGSEPDELCGYSDLVWSYHYNGSYRIVQRGPNGPEIFSLNIRFRLSWTNEDGVTLTRQGTLLDKDLQWIDNGDGTTTLVVLLTGGFHSRGPNGVINADPGQTRIAVTFDADGDVIYEQVVKGSTGRNDDTDFCATFDAVFG